MTLGDQLSDRVRQVSLLGIRKLFELAEGVDNVISPDVGEPDFSAPWTARTAAIDSPEHGKTSCTSNRGTRGLHETISERVTRYGQEYNPEDEVIVTTDANETVDLAFRAFVNPGDMVAIPQPSYISYMPGAIFAGGEPLPVPTRAEDEFKLTSETFEAAGTDGADVLVLCYPNSPTGTVITGDELTDMASSIRDHDLVVLSDEVYSDLWYEDDHTSIATHPGIRRRTIVFNGFSKAYAMTELRLSCAVEPPGTTDTVSKVRQYVMLSAPTTAQHTALEALRSCDDSAGEMRREYDRRRRFILARFEEMGLNCFEAKGASYVFLEAPDGDDKTLTESLLKEQNIAPVPESVFGEGGAGHLRVSCATEMRELREAMDRIEAHVND